MYLKATSRVRVNWELTNPLGKGCSPDFQLNMKEIQVLSAYKYLGNILVDLVTDVLTFDVEIHRPKKESK